MYKLDNSTSLLSVMRIYDIEARGFIQKQFSLINNWDDAWKELLYCILAGTQVSTDIVRKTFLELIKEKEILQFCKITYSPKYFERIISRNLRKSGYRFYKTKAKTIINAQNITKIL